MNVIISYWTETLNSAVAISVGLVLLGAINLWSVRWFGEAEFWISITKVFLIIGLMFYTLITMCGGCVE
jgi:amino acid transporter